MKMKMILALSSLGIILAAFSMSVVTYATHRLPSTSTVTEPSNFEEEVPSSSKYLLKVILKLIFRHGFCPLQLIRTVPLFQVM